MSPLHVGWRMYCKEKEGGQEMCFRTEKRRGTLGWKYPLLQRSREPSLYFTYKLYYPSYISFSLFVCCVVVSLVFHHHLPSSCSFSASHPSGSSEKSSQSNFPSQKSSRSRQVPSSLVQGSSPGGQRVRVEIAGRKKTEDIETERSSSYNP